MSSFLEFSSPSTEERFERETSAINTHNISNDNNIETATYRWQQRQAQSDNTSECMNKTPLHQGYAERRYHDITNEDTYNDNMHTSEISKEQRAWIQKQKQTIHKENAKQQTRDKHQPIQVEDDVYIEEPQLYGCTDIPLPDPQRMEEAAAVSVVAYLLIIAFLLAIAILIGTVVVSQYGVVVFVAVLIAAAAMLLVIVVVVSVIQGDRKLSKARSQIHKWSMEVKEAIMKEVADLKEDLADYSSGMLLLTYDGEFDATTDYVRDDFDNKGTSKRRKPKSIIFRFAISPLKKMTRKNYRGDSSTSDGKSKRTWFGKKKKKKAAAAANDDEQPTSSTNDYVLPPSDNLELV